MEMTLPCNQHHLVRNRYKPQPRLLRLRYPVEERHDQLPVREGYAKHVAERRRRKCYSEALLRLSAEARGSVVSVVDEASLEKRFCEQAEKWARETKHLSSPAQKVIHLSYQAILGMALENKEGVIRLLLRDLQDNRREWFWALSYLAQTNPINPKDAGKMDKMIKAWVDWGARRGLI